MPDRTVSRIFKSGRFVALAIAAALPAGLAVAETRLLESPAMRVDIDSQTGKWSLVDKTSGVRWPSEGAAGAGAAGGLASEFAKTAASPHRVRLETAGGAAVKAFETYVVKRGDCLAKIALRYGVSVAQIAERNRIDPRRPLYVNRRLKIPLSGNVGPEGGSLRPEGAERKTAKKKTAAPYSYHKVRKGESLASIARKYGTTVKEIRTLNGMKQNDTLVIQQTIRIPFPGDVRS